MKNLFIALFASLLFSLPATKVQAAFSASSADYEELTYDDLVNQLSEKKDKVAQKNNRAPSNTHVGLGIVNTWSQVVNSGHTFSPNMNGFEVYTGSEMNSDKLRGEVAFRNFFEKTNGSEKASLRELNGSMQYRREINQTWQSKFGGGLAIRFLNFSDSRTGVDVSDTSTMLMGVAGLEARLSPVVALGGEISTRFPFGNPTSDRNSLDMGIRLDTSF